MIMKKLDFTKAVTMKSKLDIFDKNKIKVASLNEKINFYFFILL